jgi:hypothetical protein
MTITVFLIALLHAAPVFVIAVWTESTVKLILAAVVAGIIGVGTGNPAYAAADLIGIAVAFGLGISFINSRKPGPPTQTKKPLPETEKSNDSSWVGKAIGLAIVAIFFYIMATNKSLPVLPPVVYAPKASTIPSPQQAPVVRSPTHSDVGSDTQRPERSARQDKARSDVRNATMQDLRDNCQPPTCKIVN